MRGTVVCAALVFNAVRALVVGANIFTRKYAPVTGARAPFNREHIFFQLITVHGRNYSNPAAEFGAGHAYSCGLAYSYYDISEHARLARLSARN